MVMNDNDDAAYFSRRAEEEDEAARIAVNPIATTIHRSLASRYRSKVFIATLQAGTISKVHD